MNQHKKLFSKIGRNYLILGILAIIFQIIILNILAMTNSEFLNDINSLTCISSICNYFLPFPIFYWLMKKLKNTKIEKNNLNIKTLILYMGISLTLMWIGNIIGLIITMLLSGAMQTVINNPVQQLINSTNIWLNLIIISIMAPICEEILFRKFLIDKTIKYGAKISIILSAVLFALFHGNLNQFFYAFLIGGFFAYVYIKTGKITYSIILHAVVNIMGSVFSIIFANAVNNIQINFTPLDGGIILGYILILVISLIMGIYGLTKIKKARFNGEKTEISLKSPFKTVFLNYGMIIFILFYIFEIVYQVL